MNTKNLQSLNDEILNMEAGLTKAKIERQKIFNSELVGKFFKYSSHSEGNDCYVNVIGIHENTGDLKIVHVSSFTLLPSIRIDYFNSARIEWLEEITEKAFTEEYDYVWRKITEKIVSTFPNKSA